ncbi:18S rRNA (guanine1575-N7)-methyltransferase [Octopus vulgaris]|uniref:18S rRNA (Guanine1575-N7)-methyltransferase n=2 Tax=Octopus TaxID=6643 RepID=A0AA36B3D8_OCTVU|nr:18S rRNA (guanine-N(7))-methyltransferase bud23 isoform X1 [Octopus sinensis]XP_036360782.1 18S rRNA (guanine-N(7))-methyltransferase bud23 isoform X1 [Octopus sinensis]XP_036360783.1 18S rRNA (guanine-N(7))-methyltransferase bud23 isoform X1 [Octopus sinensis]CAI9726192.1 18S rRNA (guanine1575-N7)-methyltransferase [Octopus vulgaris]
MITSNCQWLTRSRSFAVYIIRYHSSIKNPENLIYILPDTNLEKIPFITQYQQVFDLSKFNIPNLKQTSAKQRRPELKVADSRLFYTPQLALSFNNNTRQLDIQYSILRKIFEIISLIYHKSPLLLLDIGCGTGVSTESFTSNNCHFIGTDISMSMLSMAVKKKSLKSCDYLQLDHSYRLPFRPNCFDVVISTSFLQWLLVTKDSKCILGRFYSFVSHILKPNGHFLLQFYPRNISDIQLALTLSVEVFRGALFSCRPHPKRGLKLFLFLYKEDK